jgi:hypothetical protein
MKAFSEPRHRTIAEVLIGLRAGKPAGKDTQELARSKRAVFLFYPCLDVKRGEKKEDMTMGFALLFPRNNLSTQMAFAVRDTSQPDAVVVSSSVEPKKARGPRQA